jgi:hypothetical protein
MNRSQLIERYEKGAELFVDAIKGAPSRIWDDEPFPGKWTVREIVHHTADAEVVFSARIRVLGAEDGAKIMAFDQDKWANNLGYEMRPVDASAELFVALRHANAAMLRALPDEAWSHIGNHPERGPLKIEDMVNTFIAHGENHARAIREASAGLLRSVA